MPESMLFSFLSSVSRLQDNILTCTYVTRINPIIFTHSGWAFYYKHTRYVDKKHKDKCYNKWCKTMNETLLDFFAVFCNQLLSHSVGRCIISPFLFSSPLLDIPFFFRNRNPPLLTPITGKCQILLCHTGIWETEET